MDWPALRVNQLDATVLESEIVNLVNFSVRSSFASLCPSLIERFDPEIDAALKFMFWKYAMERQDSSVGQDLLGMCYKSRRTSGKIVPLVRWQRILHGIIPILLGWCKERYGDFKQAFCLPDSIDKLLLWLMAFSRVASLVNFVLFLMSGEYVSVRDRMLRVCHVFKDEARLRMIGYDEQNRDLLWHAFSDFLIFVLPVINIRKLVHTTQRLVFPSTQPSFLAKTMTSCSCICPVCGGAPTNSTAAKCGHVFCYYCLAASVLVDRDYRCPDCDVLVA